MRRSSCTVVGTETGTTTRSPRYADSSMSWFTNRIVTPSLRHTDRTGSSRSARVCASTAASGSSFTILCLDEAGCVHLERGR
jgi:hypothetical protein